MSLSVGIVGLPNVGKSTLFNALLKKQQAYAANFPFATIEPNVGVVPVPDRRLDFLAETIASQNSNSQISISNQFTNPNFQFQNKDNWPPLVPATVTFVDIAGLIAGAHKGEGLGNKFLHHIREVDAICHVVRAFGNEDIVKEGSVDPETDLQVIETELQLADLSTLENTEKKQKKDATADKLSAHKKLKEALGNGVSAREVELTKDERKEARELFLLTAKPILVVLNVEEEDLKDAANIENKFASEISVDQNQVIAICAKTEEELAGLSEADAKEYLKDLGVENSGLERLIKKAFSTLGLITFLTAGEKEVRAWTIKKGINAQAAAGVIHTDFSKYFIKADVVNYENFLSAGGWKSARDKGKVRSEGRDYVVQDGDVVEFKIGG